MGTVRWLGKSLPMINKRTDRRKLSRASLKRLTSWLVLLQTADLREKETEMWREREREREREWSSENKEFQRAIL